MILIDPDLDPDRRPAAQNGPSSPASRRADRDDRLPAARTLNAFLREAQTAVRLKGIVSVLLTSDAAIQTLNHDFRRKNKPTDVLSFPAAKISRGEVAGDLAISVHTARTQAREQGHSLGIEIKVLILHGLLHLAGYDHETDAGEMARRERLLRAKLALPLGLIERTRKEVPPVSPVSPVLARRGGRPAVARVSAPTPAAPPPAQQRSQTGFVTGHGFSRAESHPKKSRALAPEGNNSRPRAPRKARGKNALGKARSAAARTAGAS